jgi:hypothetical protein
MESTECVEFLLTHEERAENAGVLVQLHAQTVHEGDVCASELQAHSSVEITRAVR